MGNIQKTINSYMIQLDELIKNENFEEAKKKFVNYENELKNNTSREKRHEIVDILMELLEPETKNNLKNYINNLVSADKIYLIFKEIYEDKLLKSCYFEIKEISKEKEIKEYHNSFIVNSLINCSKNVIYL